MSWLMYRTTRRKEQRCVMGDMGNVAQLFPYRDADNRLMFRGKIGVESKVSKFFPVRVDGRLMLRGKGPDGKILWGYPYRDSEGRLMGRTIRRGITTPCGCPGCYIVVTLSGFASFGGGGGSGCGLTDFRELNGTHTLTLSDDGRIYFKAPADNYDWSPCSECTIAETFPAAGTRIGPSIHFDTGVIYYRPGYIDILGRSLDGSYPCGHHIVTNGIYSCGDLVNYIGHTWYYGTVRLDAVL